MMVQRQLDQTALFYEFSLERHFPAAWRYSPHWLTFDWSPTAREDVAVGYCYGIRSELRLYEEVRLILAYGCFRRLSLEGEVPDTRPSPRIERTGDRLELSPEAADIVPYRRDILARATS